MAEEDLRDWERLCELIWGCAIGQAIHVCVELGIPELLDVTPRSAGELATETHADPWTLETVLRALVAFDILAIETDRYTLARMGRMLLKSSPAPSAGEAGEFFDTIYRPLGELGHMVRTGAVPFDRVYGKSFYEHLGERTQLRTHFYDTMRANAEKRYAGVSSVCDLSSVSRIVDVGGGEGSLLVQLLQEHPHLKGVVFDLPLVSDRARARILAAGLTDRCDVVPGDFFEHPVPRGGDRYVLAQVLNNWRDAEVCRILTACHRAMTGDARLLLLEPVAGFGPSPRWRALVSLGVMAQRGGRSRSEPQLRSVLAASGFQLERIEPLPRNATCLIEARPIV